MVFKSSNKDLSTVLQLLSVSNKPNVTGRLGLSPCALIPPGSEWSSMVLLGSGNYQPPQRQNGLVVSGTAIAMPLHGAASVHTEPSTATVPAQLQLWSCMAMGCAKLHTFSCENVQGKRGHGWWMQTFWHVEMLFLYIKLVKGPWVKADNAVNLM